jgi:hypothetical protein
LAFGIDVKVAMISYSTAASGSGYDVEKVRAATEMAHARRPELVTASLISYDESRSLYCQVQMEALRIRTGSREITDKEDCSCVRVRFLPDSGGSP